MSSHDWPDWLPSDWFMQVRNIDGQKVKCYIDPEGHTCYSKPEVFEHLKKISNGTATQNADDSALDPDVPQTNESTPQGRPKRQTTKSKEIEGSLETHGDSKWLPDGWTCEVKVRTGGSSTGMKYKIYTDPISGQKFFSKPQVLSHLAKINGSPAVQREVSNLVEKYATKADESQKSEVNEKKTRGNRMSSDFEVVSRTPVDGLPEGWIKEDRMRKGAKKKDPYYLDPLSDYAFYSKKDALRYLDSGDIRTCAIKPLKRNVDEDNNHLTPSGGELLKPSPVTTPSKVTQLTPSKETGTSEPLPNGSETETGTGTENKRSVRSITGGSFSKEEVSDWLPEGWTVEVNYKSSGLKYKSYHELATGKKFYSKPQVLNYLSGGSTSNSNSRKRKENKPSASVDFSPNSGPASGGRPKRSSNKSAVIKNADFTEEITTTPAEGLPPGWIKEVRTKIYSTHKRSDPFYIDPVSGYIFRSKVDVFRYLETGDVNLCAIRPKMKDQDGNEVSVFTHDVQKVKTASKTLLTEEGETLREKQENDESTPARGRSSSRIAKRQKGPTENNGAAKVEENEDQGSGINLEKVAEDDGRLSYDIPEDDNWTDQCLDFAVKTLTNEIMFNGQPASGETSVNETPTKVN